MPCLSGRFSADGIILSLACLPPGTRAPATNPAPKFFTALLDTGASNTCISPKVVSDLRILTTGMQQMASATQVMLVNTYLVDIGIVFGRNILWKFTNLPVLEFQPNAGSPYEILLGRDVVCQGALTISFDGHYTFSI